MPADNELKFTAKLDVNPVIKAAKDLAKAISDATKVKTDNAVFAKGAEYLSRQSAEIRKINQGLAKEETYKRDIAAYNQKVAEWEQKRVELNDLIRGRKYAQGEIDDRKAKAIGLYSGRTDKTALDNQDNLVKAQKRLVDIDSEITKTESSIAKFEAKLESSYNKIVKSEEASRAFTQQFESAGEAAQEIQNHAKGISDESNKTSSYIKEQEQAIRGAEEATKSYEKTSKDANQDVASSFEESSEKTSKSAKDSAQKAQEAFETIKNARQSLGDDWGFDFEADVTKMDDASLTRRRDELLSVANAFRAIKIPEEYADFFNRLNQALIETQTQLNNVHRDIKSSFDISNMKVPDLAANVTKMGEGELKNYKNELKAFMKTLEGMGATTEQVYYDASLQLAKTDIQLKQVRADIKDVAMEQMGLKEEPIEIDFNADTASMHILQLISYFRQLKAEKERLLGVKDPTEEDSARYNTVVEKLNEADQALKNLEKDYEDVEEVAKGSTTASQNFANSFKTFSDAFVSISQANGFLNKLKAGLEALGPTAITAGIMSKEAFTMATAGLNLIIEIVAKVISLFQSLANVARNVARIIWNAFKKVANMVKRVIDGIKSGLDKIKSSFSSAFSFSGSDLKRTLQMLTKYIFGVRSFFFLYRKLRSAVKEGLENLVQFESASNETNHAITELRTSLLYLKNAWAAAFAPIINAVYPILVSFLDMLARVGNAIARFVAALTGQSTVLQALRVDAGDYADSLKDAAGGASKAANAQEELNDRLAAFDDLNVLGVDDDKNKSPSGGGGGADNLMPTPNEMFERIATPMTDLVKLVQEAWETGNAFRLGEFFASRLSDSLDDVNAWLEGEGRNKVMKIATLIASLMDGVLSVDDLGDKFGTAIGNALVLAMDFVNTIITPNRMIKIGTQIADAFNSAIPIILPKLGKTIGNLFKSAIANAWAFLTTADFISWGDSFAQAVNNFIAEMSSTVTTTTAKGTPQWGAKIFDTGLTGWEMLGQDVTKVATGIFDFIQSVLENVDWHEVGRSIGKFLNSIEWSDIADGLGGTWKAINDAFAGLWEGISEDENLSKELEPIARIIDTLGTSLERLLNAIDPETLERWLTAIPEWIETITDVTIGLWTVLEPFFTFVIEHPDLVVTLIAIGEALKIISGVLATVGGVASIILVVQALTSLGGLGGIASAIAGGAAAVGTTLLNAVSSAGTVAGALATWGVALTGIATAAHEAYGAVEAIDYMVDNAEQFEELDIGYLNAITGGLHNVGDELIEGATAIGNTFTDGGFVEGMATVRDGFLDMIGLGDVTGASERLEEWGETAQYTASDTAEAFYISSHDIDDAMTNIEVSAEWGTGILEAVSDKSARAITNTINSGYQDMANYYARIGNESATAFDTFKTNAKDAIEKTAQSLDDVPEKFNNIKGAIDTQSVAMKDTMSSSFENIKQESVDSAKIIQDNFLLASDNIKNSFIESWAEINKSISEGGDMFVALSDGMGNTVKSLLNAMINGINISITKPLQDISKSFNVLRTLDVNGARPFAGIPYLNIPPIPHLAQGAVIPPNKQFMAVLGDQTSGTNIEAPLDTIKAAVGEEFAPYADMIVNAVLQVVDAVNNKPVLSDRDIGKANARFTSQQKLIRGTSL